MGHSKIPSACAVINFRIAHFFYRYRILPMARLFYLLNLILWGADIYPNSDIGPGFLLPHPNGVVVMFRGGRNITLFQQITVGIAARDDPSEDGLPDLGNDVCILPGARVFGPIRIGDGVVVGANTVVMHSVPERAVIAGMPASVIGYRGQASYQPTEDGLAIYATVGDKLADQTVAPKVGMASSPSDD